MFLSTAIFAAPAGRDVDDPVKMINGSVFPRVNSEAGQATFGVTTSHFEDDPLIVAPDAHYRGLIAYTFSSYKSPVLSNFIVVLDSLNKKRTVYAMKVENNGVLQPQFSPDGRALLVKVGRSNTLYPRYRFYVLNLLTGKWKKVPSAEVNFPEIVWSPDSRYIAFVEGGDIFGRERLHENGEPLRLMVCQWQQAKTQVIAQNSGVVGGFSFASSTTLLFTQLPSGQSQTSSTPSVLAPQPNLYQVNFATKGKPQLLLRYAQHPLVSPDGQRLVFFGAENVQHPSRLAREWWSDPQGTSLSVADCTGKRRTILTLARGFFSPTLWPQQKAEFLMVDQIQGSPMTQFIIKRWNLANSQWHLQGNIFLKDSRAATYSQGDPQIRPNLNTEKDGSFFFVATQIAGPPTGDSFWVQRSIQRYDAKTGKTLMVAQVRDQQGDPNNIGIDMHSTR